jgi:hypothetical protein
MRAGADLIYPFAVAKPMLSRNTNTCSKVYVRPTINRRSPISLTVCIIEGIGIFGDLVNLE